MYAGGGVLGDAMAVPLTDQEEIFGPELLQHSWDKGNHIS